MEKEIRNRTKVKIVVITLIMFVMLITGFSYAYFTIQVSGNEEASSIGITTTYLRLDYTDLQVMSGDNIYPGWSQSKVITVENTGDATVKYDIIWREIYNEITNNELTLSMTCTSNIGQCAGLSATPISTYLVETSNVLIKDSISIQSGETHTYAITVTFTEASSNQNYNQGKSVHGTINIIESPVRTLYKAVATDAQAGTYATEYTGVHKDSPTGVGGNKIYYYRTQTANDTTQANALLDKINVIYAGFCWQILRTTDTGGVKLIYNGVPTNDTCPSGRTAQLSSTSYFSGDNLYNSPAYVGYKWGAVYTYSSENSLNISGHLYGEDVSYNSTTGEYTLVNPTALGVPDSTHHYSCASSSESTCSNVRFYYYGNSAYSSGSSGTSYYYITLNGATNIENALEKMFTENTTSSAIKTVIDGWYETYIENQYDEYLEDIVFCNDRSISDLGGWSKTGDLMVNLQFRNVGTVTSLDCPNVSDQFSVSNNSAKLSYPVGLASAPEMNLINNRTVRNNGSYYWLLSPHDFVSTYAYGRYVSGNGSFNWNVVGDSGGVRPLVSLSSSVEYIRGNGSKNSPYIITE